MGYGKVYKDVLLTSFFFLGGGDLNRCRILGLGLGLRGAL